MLITSGCPYQQSREGARSLVRGISVQLWGGMHQRATMGGMNAKFDRLEGALSMHVWSINRHIYTWNNMLERRKWDTRPNLPYQVATFPLDEAGGCFSRTGNIASPRLGNCWVIGSSYQNQRMGTS